MPDTNWFYGLTGPSTLGGEDGKTVIPGTADNTPANPNPTWTEMETSYKAGVQLRESEIDKQLVYGKNFAMTSEQRAQLIDGPWFHPLANNFSRALPPLDDPTPPTGTEMCYKDCKERERIRKKECAEVRKRVSQKLKDMGCPSTVSAIAQNFGCGGGKKKKAKVEDKKKVTAKSASKKRKKET